MVDKHTKVLDHLSRHYSKLARHHGDAPKAVQYSDEESHWHRFRILTEIGVQPKSTVIDFGCGSAELLRYMQTNLEFCGDYFGIDISPEQINLAQRKYPKQEFVCADIFSKKLQWNADFILINGVFNNKVPNSDSFQYMCDILQTLMPHANKGIAFNAMSSFVDYFAEDLAYFDPATVFNFCKEHLSNSVTLRHDYRVKSDSIPFEFCVYVYVDDSKLRRNQLA